MSSRIPARVWILLGAGLIAIGFSPILVRFASDAPGVVVAVWRTGLSALLLAPVALSREWENMRRLSGKELLLIVAAGVLLGVHFVTWIESLYHTSVASASVLVATSPIFIAVLGFLFLKERLSGRMVLAILAAVLGAVLIGVSDSGEGSFPKALLGNLLAVSAALFVSVYLLIGKSVRQRISFLAYLFPLYTTAALTTLVVAIAQGAVLVPSLSVAGWCLLMALGPQLLGHGSINYAVKYVPVALIGLLSLLEPVVASVMAFGLFGELPPHLAIVGMAVVLLSIASVFVGKRSDQSQLDTGRSEKRLRPRKK